MDNSVQSVDVFEFLRILHPQGIFEIRSPKCPPWKGAKKLGAAIGYFTNFDDALRCIQRIDSELCPPAVYVSLNRCKPALAAKSLNQITFGITSTSKDDIIRRTALLIDIDPVRPSGISSTQSQMERAIELANIVQLALEREGWPPPLKGMSGNGAYLIFRVDLANDAQTEQLIKDCLLALDQRFSDSEQTGAASAKVDTSTFDANRVCKVLGTMARKGSHVVGMEGIEDMPHRRSYFVPVNGPLEAVSLNLLEALAATVQHVEKTKAVPRQFSRVPSSNKWIDQWIENHNIDVGNAIAHDGGRKWIFNSLPGPCENHPGGHGADGTAFILQKADGAVAAGCLHERCTWKWQELRLYYEPDAYDTPTLGSKDEVVEHLEATKIGGQQGNSAGAEGENPINSLENTSNHRTAHNETLNFVPFPTRVLPAPIADFIEQTAKAMDCDESFVALPVLASLAAAIGNTRVLEIKSSWCVPSILWTAVVALSGAGKSSPFKAALRPTQARQQRLVEEFKAQLKEYEKQQAIYLRDLQAFKKSKDELPPIAPEEPVCQRVIVDDTTIEALGKRLSESPRGVICAKDELSGWFASFARYKTTNTSDESKWLEFYSAHKSIIDRSSAKLPLIIPKALVCLTGTIQPEILRKSLTADHKASGLAARILFAMPPKRIRRWTDFEPEESVVKQYEYVQDRLFELELQLDEYGGSLPTVIRLSPDAQTLFISFFNRHNKEQDDTEGDLYAAYSKLEECAARFALIIHCIESVLTSEVSCRQLTLDSMTAGVQICEWFKNEARRLYEVLSEDQSNSGRIVAWLKTQTKPVTGYGLHRQFRNFVDSAEAESFLQQFVNDGSGLWIPITNPKGGRPTRGFRFHGAAVTT